MIPTRYIYRDNPRAICRRSYIPAAVYLRTQISFSFYNRRAQPMRPLAKRCPKNTPRTLLSPLCGLFTDYTFLFM